MNKIMFIEHVYKLFSEIVDGDVTLPSSIFEELQISCNNLRPANLRKGEGPGRIIHRKPGSKPEITGKAI